MPIFIVGYARSGTTLCQKLVSQHLGIPTLPETHYFEFLEDHEPAGGHITPEAASALVRQLEPFLEVDATSLRPLLARPEVPIRQLFLQLVGQQIGSQAVADKGQWIEKTPGHAEHLERIYQMFPKARFICMVRNPVHAFASRRELQASGRGWGEEWKPIEAFCAAWALHVQNVREFGERHPGQLLTIRLEDLVADAPAQLARVHEFVGPGFANPVDAPRHPDIVQPFETWKRDALKPVDKAIAEREGKPDLDPYETWRVRTILRPELSMMGYPVEAEEPADLDQLHRRLVASLDWYREQFARRDSLMDVKTARIRGLLNELAERRPVAATARPLSNPLLIARVGAPSGHPAANAAHVSLGPGTVARMTTASSNAKQGLRPAVRPATRPGARAGARGKAVAKSLPAQTHAQRNSRHFIVDQEGPLEDNLPTTWRPFTLHGISGINDNGATFLAEAEAIVARRSADGAGRGSVKASQDITDATEGA